jgi:lysyl-tRNA synthetase class 2
MIQKQKDQAEKKAKQAAEAAERAAAKAAKGGDGAGKLEDDESEELNPSKYREYRLNYIKAKKDKGENPYPHKFHQSIQLPDYVQKYKDIDVGSRLEEKVTVTGAHHAQGRVRCKAYFL